ncbi:MAG: ethanolamine ammonia lyase large subunit, partial [Deltaproteobacteria bacterium]
MFDATHGTTRTRYPTLAALMAAATPLRSGDRLAGIAADSAAHRVAAQATLADLPLVTFLTEAVIP